LTLPLLAAHSHRINHMEEEMLNTVDDVVGHSHNEVPLSQVHLRHHTDALLYIIYTCIIHMVQRLLLPTIAQELLLS
jgi:hypothetical protein